MPSLGWCSLLGIKILTGMGAKVLAFCQNEGLWIGQKDDPAGRASKNAPCYRNVS